MAGTLDNGLNDKFTETTGNQVGNNLANPFAEGSSALSLRDFRLASSSSCVNKGAEYIDRGNGQVDYFDLPATDMDFTDRIKDCTVDIGAYKLENIENTTPQVNGTTAIYYVTQNGEGMASGNLPENAACAEKLQTVLNAAGIYKQEHTDYEVIVKVAGYSDNEEDENASGFVYHANTLADEKDPQSYSYTIPYGVILKGGYDEFPEDGSGWNNSNRDVIAHPTKLSAIKLATSTAQEVNGYHVVTFSEKPNDWGTDTTPQQSVVDGVWLVDGSATSLAGAGSDNTRGGGAIVPAWAHVRNCIVQGNEAVQGGGLYVLPGGTVSGTAVLGNTADDGGGIYADNEGTSESNRAHIISCTIADNSADDGGGIYLEDGAAMSVNTVIWGNTASSNKNVSGVTAKRFNDNELKEVFGLSQNDYYPFNDCFIESMELPSDLENSSMESDSTLYFMDGLRRLKEFSPLIKHGLKSEYQDELETTFSVAAKDMQNTDRNQSEADRLDAGAFAYLGGILPTDLFTRIFVSQTTNVKLSEGENMLNYLGRSFYTSFSTLEDALAYIRKMREEGKANNSTEFEILMGGGTYKPNYQRTVEEGEASESVTHDQRLYSFVIPEGVSIYGGFSGTENYITPEDMQEGSNPPVTSIPSDELGDITSWNDAIDVNDLLDDRDYSDFNGNGIEEPWKLANQTILSSNINVSSEAKNSYHVIYSSTENTNANANVLDGLTVMDGETYDKLTSVTEKDEAGRGGGLYSNSVPYTINRCRFMNNFGIRGGAVYVRDARLNVIGSIFAGNGIVEKAETPPTQPARGGAIFIGASKNSTNPQLFAVNSLFVNNETSGEGGSNWSNLRRWCHFLC